MVQIQFLPLCADVKNSDADASGEAQSSRQELGGHSGLRKVWVSVFYNRDSIPIKGSGFAFVAAHADRQAPADLRRDREGYATRLREIWSAVRGG